MTKVLGNVEATRADVSGRAVVGGTVTARSLTVRGTLDVVGTLTVSDELTLRGELRVGPKLVAGGAALSGSVVVAGPVEIAGRCVIRGNVTAASVSARQLQLGGTVRIPGPIRADSVDLELEEESRLGGVAGRTVRAQGPAGRMVDQLLGRHRSAHIDRIDAESAWLEQIEVGFVSAQDVTVGRGSHIAQLEAARSHVHPGARVGPESRTPPPRGLRR